MAGHKTAERREVGEKGQGRGGGKMDDDGLGSTWRGVWRGRWRATKQKMGGRTHDQKVV